jgi:hypothetical protein
MFRAYSSTGFLFTDFSLRIERRLQEKFPHHFWDDPYDAQVVYDAAMFVLYGTPTSSPSVPNKPAPAQSPAQTSSPLPSHQEFFDQFFSNLSSTIASTIRCLPTSSPSTPAPTVSVQSLALSIVPAPAPTSLPVLTPDSAEAHLARLEKELAKLQKATDPEPKPDPVTRPHRQARERA